MAELVIARLGSVEFSVLAGSFEVLQRRTTWRIDRPDPIDGMGTPIHRGRLDDAITLSAVVFPGYVGALSSVEGLRELGDRGELQTLVDGEGAIYGRWFDVGVAPAGSGAPEGDRSQGVNGMVINTITPETARSSHYFWAFVRNYRRDEQAITHELREGVARIFREDELVLEAQQRALDEHPERGFYDLNIDAGAVWARKLIDAMIDEEHAQSKLVVVQHAVRS